MSWTTRQCIYCCSW